MCAQAVFGGPLCNVISERLARALLPEKLIPTMCIHTRAIPSHLSSTLFILHFARALLLNQTGHFSFLRKHILPPPRGTVHLRPCIRFLPTSVLLDIFSLWYIIYRTALLLLLCTASSLCDSN